MFDDSFIKWEKQGDRKKYIMHSSLCERKIISKTVAGLDNNKKAGLEGVL